MSFERIWTAVFAAACTAVPATLSIAAIGSAIPGVKAFSREGLSPTVLGVWLALSAVCVIPAKPRDQWLTALWLCVAFLSCAAVVLGVVAQAPVPTLALVLTTIALGQIARQVAKVGRE